MKVYLTKYALAKGIKEIEVDRVGNIMYHMINNLRRENGKE